MSKKPRWHYWWPTLLWGAIIFFLSSQTAVATSQIYWQDFIVKKAAHFTVYAILAVLLYRSLKHTTRLDKGSLLLVTFSLIVLYAVSDEFHQSFIPGREPRFRDVVIDAFGAACALWIIDKRGIINR